MIHYLLKLNTFVEILELLPQIRSTITLGFPLTLYIVLSVLHEYVTAGQVPGTLTTQSIAPTSLTHSARN